jgi:hypothetical protein
MHLSIQCKSYFDELRSFCCIPKTVQTLNDCLCNCAVPKDLLVRPETCWAWCLLKPLCNSNAVCAFVGLRCNKHQLILMPLKLKNQSKRFCGHDSRWLMVIRATLCVKGSKKSITRGMLWQFLFCWLLKLWYSGCYTDRYFQVVPWGFRKLLNWIAKEYNNPPVLIAENGFCDQGELNDRDRVDYHIVSGGNAGLLSKVVFISLLEAISRYPSE